MGAVEDEGKYRTYMGHRGHTVHRGHRGHRGHTVHGDGVPEGLGVIGAIRFMGIGCWEA